LLFQRGARHPVSTRRRFVCSSTASACGPSGSQTSHLRTSSDRSGANALKSRTARTSQHSRSSAPRESCSTAWSRRCTETVSGVKTDQREACQFAQSLLARGRRVLVVDDVPTLANLRGWIEHQGAYVIRATTLGATFGGTKLAQPKEALDKLLKKFPEVETLSRNSACGAPTTCRDRQHMSVAEAETGSRATYPGQPIPTSHEIRIRSGSEARPFSPRILRQ
jgi:hypothetical protein